MTFHFILLLWLGYVMYTYVPATWIVMRKEYFWSIILQYSNWDGGIGGTSNRDAISTCCSNGPILCSTFTIASSVLVILRGNLAWNSRVFMNRNLKKISELLYRLKLIRCASYAIISTRSSLTQIFVTLTLLVLLRLTIVSIDCPGTNPVVGILIRILIEPKLK